MEDLWRKVVLVTTGWDELEEIRQRNWDFSNLEHEMEKGGVLYDKKVYVFGQYDCIPVGDEHDVVFPVLIAVAVEKQVDESKKAFDKGMADYVAYRNAWDERRNMKFYKFYPTNLSDVSRVPFVKDASTDAYCGDANMYFD